MAETVDSCVVLELLRSEMNMEFGDESAANHYSLSIYIYICLTLT